MIPSLKDRFNDFGESFEYRPLSQCYFFDPDTMEWLVQFIDWRISFSYKLNE